MKYWKMAIFGNVTVCSLIEVYQCFRGACMYITLLMETTGISHMSTNFCQTLLHNLRGSCIYAPDFVPGISLVKFCLFLWSVQLTSFNIITQIHVCLKKHYITGKVSHHWNSEGKFLLQLEFTVSWEKVSNSRI